MNKQKYQCHVDKKKKKGFFVFAIIQCAPISRIFGNRTTCRVLMSDQNLTATDPGTVALSKIRRFQKSTELVIKKLAFQRLVREIVQDLRSESTFQSTAMLTLQEAAETMLIGVFKDANLIAVSNKRVVVNSDDMVRFSTIVPIVF